MVWKIKFKQVAQKLLSKLDKPMAKKIISFLKEKAKLDDPTVGAKSLKKELKGYWRYRIEDHRIVFKIVEDELVIMILRVGHRKNVFNK